MQAIESKKALVDGGDEESDESDEKDDQVDDDDDDDYDDEGEEGDDADDHVVDDGNDMSYSVQPMRFKLLLVRQVSGWGLALMVPSISAVAVRSCGWCSLSASVRCGGGVPCHGNQVCSPLAAYA